MYSEKIKASMEAWLRRNDGEPLGTTDEALWAMLLAVHKLMLVGVDRGEMHEIIHSAVLVAMRADGEPFGTSCAFLARLTEWFETGPGREAILGETTVSYRDFVNWKIEQLRKIGQANAAATAKWLEWEKNDGLIKNEPPYPFERMTEQDRSEHMEETAFALIDSGLDVSAPLDEIIAIVKEAHGLRTAESREA
jgi:hypothetical protein